MPIQKPQSRQKKISEYGSQLQEKQRLRNNYGLREKQFRRYFETATKQHGQTGRALLESLERRIDNVLFRAGFALSRAHARQLVGHRHFRLNGVRVDIPSISVKAGDVIEPHDKGLVQLRPETVELDWLDVDKKALKITVKSLPTETELPIEFDTQKVIEFYSR
ncbi:MAG: 30S ribosomal protein S4 [Candidatus Berkelbacteria bacterium]|nr:MAG: 30S ribosomal protein S4 [Candidatus Berkelbacteria bacterium]QQG52119.1 MAG: 30S ribosomal protein S4 [Candidatus Berkelbacteria bacterium]